MPKQPGKKQTVADLNKMMLAQLELLVGGQTQTNIQLGQLNQRVEGVENQLGKLNKKVDTLPEKFNASLQDRLDNMTAKLIESFKELVDVYVQGQINDLRERVEKIESEVFKQKTN